MTYLWPSDDIPLEELKLQYDKSALEELRFGTGCYLEFSAAESLIRVWSMDERAIRTVTLRIGNLLRELIAKINNSLSVRFVQYPSRGLKDAVIGLSLVPGTKAAFPILQYLTDPDLDEIDPKSQIVKLENSKTMALIVQHCIKHLRCPNQHVRMRLQIGLVSLGRRLNFRPGRQDYEFDEFVGMLGQSLTETNLER